jgi:hypothetical protein
MISAYRGHFRMPLHIKYKSATQTNREVKWWMIEQIRTVAVMVSDEKKAKEWYKDKLGFEVQSDEEHWIVVGPRGSSFGLHLCPDEPLEPGNSGILLLAGDIKSTCKELEMKGV